MTTYNATRYSTTLVTTDLQLFFELTRDTFTLDPEFAERWREWIVDMVKERLWNYTNAVMKTALGEEIYEDYLYPEDDAESGMHTLRKAYEEFAKADGKFWTGYSWNDAEVEDEAYCIECGEEFNPVEDISDTYCDDCYHERCCQDCDTEIEEDEKHLSVDLKRTICPDCYKEDVEDAEYKKKQTAEDEAKPRLTYKCRVECPDDIERVLAKCKNHLREAYKFRTTEILEDGIDVGNGVIMPIPDRTWTFTTPADLNTVRDMFKWTTDAHVGHETVQLEADYTGERNRTL